MALGKLPNRDYALRHGSDAMALAIVLHPTRQKIYDEKCETRGETALRSCLQSFG
jgi:hypothetical protein